MTIEELRDRQAHFESLRQDHQSVCSALERKRKEFLRRFPIDNLRQLTKEHYVEGKTRHGKTDKTTFCYWVEWETQDLGKMQGARSDKFGIYVDKRTQEYKFLRRYASANEAFQDIIDKVATLAETGGNSSLEDLESNDLSPMFKGKILFLYYPNRFINIFSDRHIDFFLRRIGLEMTSDELIYRRDSIVQWKNQDEVMRDWTMFEFSDFLYSEIGRPPRRSSTPAQLQEHIEYEDDYPRLEDMTPEVITLNTAQIDEATVVGGTANVRRNRVIDFEKQHRRQRRLGELGELVVLKMEKSGLLENHRDDLVGQVQQISAIDSSAGYDILSYNLDGTERHIEVKTTSVPPSGQVLFYLSANELIQSGQLANYYIYIVFEAKTTRPKVWKIENPAALAGTSLHLIPTSFRCTISTRE